MSDNATVAIVGAGLIGASWTALFCAAGDHRVTVYDPSDAVLDDFLARVDDARSQLAQLGHKQRGRVSIVHSLEEAVRNAGWIQENGPERLATKHDIYQRIEAVAAPSAIIASSTSAFRWSELSSAMKHPARFITAHPFNPPHLIPLVEIYGPDPSVVARAVAFFTAVDRKPVVLKKDAVGHIANRLSSALWREAVSIVANGIATVEDVDAALVNGPGLRWAVNGAHLTYHLGGGAGGLRGYLDQLGPSQERRWADLGSPSLTTEVKDALVEGIEAEIKGRSVADLTSMRDEALIRILNAKAGA